MCIRDRLYVMLYVMLYIVNFSSAIAHLSCLILWVLSSCKRENKFYIVRCYKCRSYFIIEWKAWPYTTTIYIYTVTCKLKNRFGDMKPPPLNQKFCATPKICKKLCCSSKIVDFTAIFLKISRCASKHIGRFWNVAKSLRSFLCNTKEDF